MYQISGTIKGVSDMLFNEFTDKSLHQIATGSTGGKYTADERVVQAEAAAPKNAAGKAIIRPWMFKQCLMNGAMKGNLKEGRKGMAQFILPTVFVDGEILLRPDHWEYIHEHWGRRPPKTGGACMIYRPAFRAGWTADFTLNVVDDRRNADQLRIALEEAGLLAGLGAWRAEYGRFIVMKWEVTHEA